MSSRPFGIQGMAHHAPTRHISARGDPVGRPQILAKIILLDMLLFYITSLSRHAIIASHSNNSFTKDYFNVATTIRIAQIPAHVGETVTVRGWVMDRTDKGKLQFIQLRDGSGVVQCVAFKKDLPEADFEQAGKLSQESSVVITGTVRADERAPGIPG